MDLIPVDTPDDKEIYIFNPTKSNFTHKYCGIPYTLKSYEGDKFSKPIADHLAKHLKDEIVGRMPGVITEEVIEKVYKDIYLT